MSFHPISALSSDLKSSTNSVVACGLSLGLALISGENPTFEMASKKGFAGFPGHLLVYKFLFRGHS
jgi:hypothetical protein